MKEDCSGEMAALRLAIRAGHLPTELGARLPSHRDRRGGCLLLLLPHRLRIAKGGIAKGGRDVGLARLGNGRGRASGGNQKATSKAISKAARKAIKRQPEKQSERQSARPITCSSVTSRFWLYAPAMRVERLM